MFNKAQRIALYEIIDEMNSLENLVMGVTDNDLMLKDEFKKVIRKLRDLNPSESLVTQAH